MITWSSNSERRVRTSLSATAFALGDRGGVGDRPTRRIASLDPARHWPRDSTSPLNPLRACHRSEHLDEIETALRRTFYRCWFRPPTQARWCQRPGRWGLPQRLLARSCRLDGDTRDQDVDARFQPSPASFSAVDQALARRFGLNSALGTKAAPVSLSPGS